MNRTREYLEQQESEESVTFKSEYKEEEEDTPFVYHGLVMGDYDGVGAEDDEEVPDRPTKLPRMSPRMELSVPQEEELAQWFQEHAIFYDQSHPDFKNRGKKDRLVDLKAAEMGVRPIQVITWFKTMRTVYGKLRKKRGQAEKITTMRQKWTLNNFAFLDSHLSVRTERRRPGAATASAETAPPASEGEESDSNNHLPPSTNSQASASSCPRQPPKAAAGGRQQLEDAIMQLASRLSDRNGVPSAIESAPYISRNPRAAFAHWMGCQTMGLSERQWRLFMVDVMHCVNRHCEADSQHRPPSGQQHH